MKKKILITSALPYVNNVPHIGNLIGAVLSADVFARFSRLQGNETLYICGSDEHGTATETKAKQEGITPQELCDKYYELHKQVYDWFNISFDGGFGRTSKQNHHVIAQDIFKKVEANGYIEEKTIVQPYSVKSQMFLADRFIEGTCPHCHYEEARGDQCDHCGKLLSPQELLHPKSTIDGTKPEFRETTHLFLRLDKLQPALETWTQKAGKNWTQNTVRTTNAWFKEGLQPRAITRDLEWGIPVPHPGFEHKVFYVWFDAPIGYISLTQQAVGEQYKDWWYDKHTQLYQFMGKDNIPFHSIIFPGTLLATNPELDATHPQTDFILPYHIDATEYLNYEHVKFSKSRGIGVFGDQVKESGIPADVWRYVLLFYRPEAADTQFTWKGLQERLNNELIANFGNFVNRTLTFTKRFFDGQLQDVTLSEAQEAFVTKWKNEIQEYVALLEQVKLRDGLMQLMKLSSMGNQYFQEAQPWKTRTDNPEQAQSDIALLNMLVKDLAIICKPYLPTTAQAIYSQLNLEEPTLNTIGQLLGNHTIGEPAVLFNKVEDEQIEALSIRFSGKQANIVEKSVLKPEDVDLRVGKIISIKKHEKADKLFVEQVDLGDKTVQIVSGLVGHYTAEELEGKHLVIVANLKPAQLRGEISQGMVLAAEDKDGKVGLVFAANAKPGERVRTVRQGTAKEEITFEEFMTLSFVAKGGEVLLNGEKLAAKDSALIIDKNIQDGKVR